MTSASTPAPCDIAPDDVHEGMQHSIETTFSESMVNSFAQLSGDYSSLHMDNDYALSAGFDKGRVVHGVLLLAFASQLIGMYLPGKRALIQSMSSQFRRPTYINDTLIFKASVTQYSKENHVLILNISVINKQTEAVHATIKSQVGIRPD